MDEDELRGSQSTFSTRASNSNKSGEGADSVADTVSSSNSLVDQIVNTDKADKAQKREEEERKAQANATKESESGTKGSTEKQEMETSKAKEEQAEASQPISGGGKKTKSSTSLPEPTQEDKAKSDRRQAVLDSFQARKSATSGLNAGGRTGGAQRVLDELAEDGGEVFEGINDMLTGTANEQKQANDMLEQAAKNSTKALEKFSGAVLEVGGMLSSLASTVDAGADSQTQTIQLANDLNMPPAQVDNLVRGIALNTSMSRGQAQNLLSGAGDLQAQFTTTTGASDWFSGNAKQFAQWGVDTTTLMPQNLVGRSPTEIIDIFQKAQQTIKDPKAQTAFAQRVLPNLQHMEGKTLDDMTLEGTEDASTLNKEDYLEDKEGKSEGDQLIQDFDEWMFETFGEYSEMIKGGATAIGAIGSIAGAAKVGGKVLGGGKSAAKVAARQAKAIKDNANKANATNTAKKNPSNLSKVAGSVKSGLTSNASKAAKGFFNVAKANPLALAANAIPAFTREVVGVEDDGGLADSALDVMEWGAWGAAAGSFIPGIGTAVGAGIGTVIGVGNEAYEWWNKDTAVPQANLNGLNDKQGAEHLANQMLNETQQQLSVTTNVEVVNNLSPDLIQTTVNQDGDLLWDSEQNVGTSG